MLVYQRVTWMMTPPPFSTSQLLFLEKNIPHLQHFGVKSHQKSVVFGVSAMDSEEEALDLIVQLHPSIPPIHRTRWTGPIAMRGRSPPRGRARGLLDEVLEFLLEEKHHGKLCFLEASIFLFGVTRPGERTNSNGKWP